MPTTNIDNAMRNILKVGILSGKYDPFVLKQLFPNLEIPSIVSAKEVLMEKQNEVTAAEKTAETEERARDKIMEVEREIISSELKMRENATSEIVKGLMSAAQGEQSAGAGGGPNVESE